MYPTMKSATSEIVDASPKQIEKRRIVSRRSFRLMA